MSRTIWLSFNSIIRTGRFAIKRELSSSVLRLFQLLRAAFMASDVLRDLIATFARLSQDDFRILFYRHYKRVAQGRLMLHRCIQARPSARKMILPRCENIACAQCTLGLQGRISFYMILSGYFYMYVTFIVGKGCRRREDLAFLYYRTSFNCFNER